MVFQRSRNEQHFRTVAASFPKHLTTIVDAISSGGQLQSIFQMILSVAIELTRIPSELGFIRTVDPATKKTTYRVTVLDTHADSILQDLSGITGRAIRTNTIQSIPDITKDRDYVKLTDGVKSELAIPISVHGQSRGVLNLESPKKGWFTKRDETWLTVLADVAALALVLEDERTNRANKEAVLARSGNPMDEALGSEIDVLLDRIITTFTFIAPEQRSNIMAEILVEVPAAEQLITLRIRPDQSEAQRIRLHKGEGTIGQVFAEGKAVAGIIDHSDPTTWGKGNRGDAAHLFGTRSSLVYPLKRGETTIGVLNVESPDPDTFSAASVQELERSGIIPQIVAKLDPQNLSEAMIVHQLLNGFADNALRGRIQQQSDIDEMYYQILNVAAQIIDDPDISAGLILIRDENYQLYNPELYKEGKKKYWMVRAAAFGDFASLPEWELDDKSLSRRIIDTKKGAIFNNAREAPGYRNSLSATETSELIVPLVDDNGTPLGVIGLDSPKLNTFENDDLKNIEQLANLAVQVIKRGETFTLGQRAKNQLVYVRELQEELAKLFPKDINTLADVDIQGIRQRVFNLIMQRAYEITGSDYSILVLPELLQQETDREQTLLRIHHVYPENLPVDRSPWEVTTGITGEAYRTGKTQTVADVRAANLANPNAFVDRFPDVQSEIAIPLQREGKIIGVLDFESKNPHNYTRSTLEVAEFLAAQCAFAMSIIDSALQTQNDLILSKLNRELDQLLNTFAALPMVQIRGMRDEELGKFLQEYLRISGATVGRVLLAQNVYVWGSDTIDEVHGTMHYMVSTLPQETAPTADRFFPISRGASVIAFREKRTISFNNAQSSPPQFFEHDTGHIESGLFVPLYEGAVVVGVLDIESEQPNTFTPEAIASGERVAAMASKIVSATRLRLRESYAQRQSDFELETLQSRSTDMEAFAGRVLRFAAELSELHEGLGKLVLTRNSDDEQFFEAEQTYTLALPATPETPAKVSSERHPVQFEVYQRALREKAPILIVDTQKVGTPLDLSKIAPQARSIICVPLSRAKETAAGVLFLAASNPSEFSEADKYTLTAIAQTTRIGLNNIALLNESKELMSQVRHDFISALRPFEDGLDLIEPPLQAAITSSDTIIAQQFARDAYDHFAAFRDASELIANLMHWFFDLSNNDLRPDATDAPTNVAVFQANLQRPFNTLASNINGEGWIIHWDVAKGDISISGGLTQKMINAVLFKFVDNAIKFTEQNDMTIRIYPTEDKVAFAVSNSGTEIDEFDRRMLFQLHFRADTSKPGSGIGLYQVQQIAQRLKGSVKYSYEGGKNIFTLYVPRVKEAPHL